MARYQFSFGEGDTLPYDIGGRTSPDSKQSREAAVEVMRQLAKDRFRAAHRSHVTATASLDGGKAFCRLTLKVDEEWLDDD